MSNLSSCLYASLHGEEQDSVVRRHGHILVVTTDEIRVSHSKKVLVLNACRVLASSDPFNVDIADVIGFAHLVVEEDVDVFTVVHSRDHKFI